MPQTTKADDLKIKKSALRWADHHFGHAVTELERIATDDEDAVTILNIVHELKRAHSKILYMRAIIQNTEASQPTNLQKVKLAEEELQKRVKKAAKKDAEGSVAETKEI